MRGYHLTKKSNLYGETGIIKRGLIPQCGERSKSINDKRIVVCFTDDYYTLPVWALHLYPKVDWSDLCVLTFDIPEEQTANYKNECEFETPYPIFPDNISIAHFIKKESLDEVPFYFLQRDDTEIKVVETPISMMPQNELLLTSSLIQDKNSLVYKIATHPFF